MIKLELNADEAEHVVDALDARTSYLRGLGDDYRDDAAEVEAIRVRLEMEMLNL